MMPGDLASSAMEASGENNVPVIAIVISTSRDLVMGYSSSSHERCRGPSGEAQETDRAIFAAIFHDLRRAALMPVKIGRAGCRRRKAPCEVLNFLLISAARDCDGGAKIPLCGVGLFLY